MEGYSFRDVAEICGTCQKSFGEDEDVFSALRRQEDRFERLDFCAACWKGSGEDEVFCFWKRKPRIKEAQPIADGLVVFDIFQTLENSVERHDQSFRYILALLLMRRKRLKFVDITRTEEGEFLVLQDRQLDGVKYRLLDPGMNEEEMQRAKDEVGKLFCVNVDKENKEPEKTNDGQGVSEMHKS